MLVFFYVLDQTTMFFFFWATGLKSKHKGLFFIKYVLNLIFTGNILSVIINKVSGTSLQRTTVIMFLWLDFSEPISSMVMEWWS